MTSPNPIGEGAREIADAKKAIRYMTATQKRAMKEGGAQSRRVAEALCFDGLVTQFSEWPGLMFRKFDEYTPLGLAVRSLLASTQVTK